MDRSEQLENILDHYQNPRHHGELAGADVHVEGGLPGCSDLVTLYLKIEGDKIEQVSFTGEGCTISQASASMLSELVAGMSLEDAAALDHDFISDMIGKEIVETRPRCATLSLDVLRAALKKYRKEQIEKGK